jgi:1-deoxyxylulose-5-phosphate synthase
MKYRRLGNTGIEVSELALGTVELGVDYGFRGSKHSRKPDVGEAIHLIRQAVALGVNFIDTARVYGSSEEVIGIALAGMPRRPNIASKVLIPPDEVPTLSAFDLQKLIQDSVAASLKALRVETIDLLQIHQTTSEILHNDAVLDCLGQLKQEGRVRFLGASVDREDVALEVLENPLFQTLQIPFNILDQRMAKRLFHNAAKRGTAILVRSAFLRGVLTTQLDEIPDKLAPLKNQVHAMLSALEKRTQDLACIALRFCLSNPAVSSVIVGMQSLAELRDNLSAASEGPFTDQTMQTLRMFSMEDEELVSPAHWQGLILG